MKDSKRRLIERLKASRACIQELHGKGRDTLDIIILKNQIAIMEKLTDDGDKSADD